MIWSSNSPQWCNYAAHTIGAIPSSAVIGAAHASLLYHVNYARAGQIMLYSGGYKYVGGNNSTENVFHVPFPQTAHPNASGSNAKKRYFAIIFCAYPDASDTTADIEINQSGGPFIASLAASKSATNSMADGAIGVRYQYIWAQDYDAANALVKGEGALAYNCFSVKIWNVYIGSFSAFEIQPGPSIFNTLAGRDFNIHPTVLGGGMAVRGCDAPTAAPYGVGTMLQNQMSRDAGYDSLVGSSRRCLFSWCHPQGVYAIGEIGVIGWDYLFTDQQGNNIKFKLWPRQLTGVNPQDVDIVVVARSDADTRLLVWFDNLGAGKEIEFNASANAKLYVAQWDDSIADLTSELVFFEVYVSNAKAVEIKSIQIWERETVVR
jgi:hypothetical protein